MTPRHIREVLEPIISGPELQEHREALLELAETLFFASLATEEKAAVRVAIAWALDDKSLGSVRDDDEYPSQYDEPELAWEVLPLDCRAFTVSNIVKASALVEYGRGALAIGGRAGEFVIEGVARRNPRTNGGRTIVAVAPAPGVVSLYFELNEFFRYERGAAVDLTPDVLFEAGPVLDAINGVGAALKLATSMFTSSPFPRTVRGLVAAMHRTQHGGLLLLTPAAPTPPMLDAVKLKARDPESLSRPLVAFHRARQQLASRRMARKGGEEPQPGDLEIAEFQEEVDTLERRLDQVIDDIGRLTAADNALLIGPGFTLFGAQYEVPSVEAPVASIATDVAGTPGSKYDLKLHGSRHRAGACFASANRGSIAFVASADGPMKCFLNRDGTVLMWHIRLPEM